MKFISTLTLLFLSSHLLFSQQYQASRKIITDQSGEYHFYTLRKTPENLKFNNVLTYFWFDDRQIRSNQGGASGELLHGAYECYFPDKRLQKQGGFFLGLKDGQWKYWNSDGFLLQIETYEKGLLNGAFERRGGAGLLLVRGSYSMNQKDGEWSEFDSTGKFTRSYTWKKGKKEGDFTEVSSSGIIKGTYRNNLINGKLYYMNGEKCDSVKYYKNGTEIVKKKKEEVRTKKVKAEASQPKEKAKSEAPKTKEPSNQQKLKAVNPKPADTTQPKTPFWKKWFKKTKKPTDSIRKK